MTATVGTDHRLRLDVGPLALWPSDLHALLCYAYSGRADFLPVDLSQEKIEGTIRAVLIMYGLDGALRWKSGVECQQAAQISAWAWRLIERRFPTLIFTT
ncbi:hypothetical protein ACIBBE_24485 [Streptomyces sp. NPDC051644]|uniref:hypothetical protein n=1 Tax=Streptomyces sp. NPDC051644 TaxID=3365666 RepID=UPI0037AAC0AA